MKLTAYRFYFLGAFVILCGCITRYVPSEYDIGAKSIPSFKPKGTVRLTNAQKSTTDSSIVLPANRVAVNYREYTEITINLLKRELRKNGAIVSGYGAKEIKLAIVDIQVHAIPGTFRCFIDYTVNTGDGYVRGNEAVGSSWKVDTAIDTAVRNVAVGVLNDEKILTYLEK